MSSPGRDCHTGLFITDLDGTLLTDKRQVGDRDLATLVSLRSKGIVNAVATGRSFHSFTGIMAQLDYLRPESPLAIDYVIFSTGAGIMDFPGTTILRSHSLAHRDVLEVSRFLEKNRIDYMVQKPVPDTHHFIYSYHGEPNPDFITRVDLYRNSASPMTQGTLEEFGEATQLLCVVPARNGDRVAALVAEEFKGLSVIKATSPLDHQSIWVEIFPFGVSKSGAASWLVQHLGLTGSTFCAVGNDYNDEDLLNWASAGYITDNGPKSMKKSFPCVASNNNSGVSDAATRWLGKQQL